MINMAEEKLKKIIQSFGDVALTGVVYNDNYYVSQSNSTRTTLLLQEKEDRVEVWSYDLTVLDFNQLCSAVENCFEKSVVFPYMFGEEEIRVLEERGYQNIKNIKDDKKLENLKTMTYPSFIKTYN